MRLRRSIKIKTASQTSILKRLWESLRNIELKLIALLILSYLFVYSEFSNADVYLESRPFDNNVRDKISGSWKMKMSGRSASEGLDDATYVDYALNPKFKYKLTDNFSINSDLALILTSSQVQSRFVIQPGNRVTFNELVGNFNFVDKIDLQVGAVNQGFISDSLIISKYTAFPGAKASLQFIDKKALGIKGSFTVTSAVPTSHTLNTNLSEKESIPGFSAEAFSLEKNASNHAKLGIVWGVSGGHYAFSNLPSVVSYTSGLYGNTTNGELSPGSKFIYEFNGGFLSGSFGFELNNIITIKAYSNYVKNFQAPERFNRGGQNEVEFCYGKKDASCFYSGLRFMESDVAPAYYMSSECGFTNRTCEYYGASYTSNNLGFKVSAELINSDVINKNTNQDKLNSFYIKVETASVKF